MKRVAIKSICPSCDKQFYTVVNEDEVEEPCILKVFCANCKNRYFGKGLRRGTVEEKRNGRL